MSKVGNAFVEKVTHGTLSPFGGTWIWGCHAKLKPGQPLLSEPILTDQLVAYFGMRPFTIYGSEDKN